MPSGAWKFPDFRGDFHAGRAGRVKRGVEIRHLKSQGERRLAGHGVGERERLAGDVVFDPPLAGAGAVRNAYRRFIASKPFAR